MQVHLHHRRHRDPRGAGQREADRGDGGVRQAGDALRRPDAAAETSRASSTLLKLSLTLAAPADPKEREELTRIAAAHGGRLRQGQVLPDRDPTSASTSRTSRRSWRRRRDPKQLLDVWNGWHAIAPPIKQGLRALRRARQQGRAGARLPGHGRDVALEVRHAARRRSRASSTGSGSRCGRSTSRSTPTCAGSCARSTATPCRRPARSRRTCSATCGRRTGTTSTRWSRPKDADPGFDLTEILKSRQDRRRCQMVRYGEGFFTLARLRPAAEDLLGALAVREAARPRRRLPRERLGHRLRRRPAHQDVHRHHRRGLRRRSTTSSATTSTSAPTTSSRSSSATAPTTASTRRSATRSRSRSRPSTS